MNKWLEYSLVAVFLTLVPTMMYGSYYANLVEESQLPELLDDGSGGQNSRQTIPV